MTKAYLTGTELGEMLLESVRQMKAGKIGRVTVVGATHASPSALAADARHKTGLSQGDFARVLGISARTLQEWEQGRREPSGAAKTLLRIAAKRPEVILETME
jgi:putative transcriptional regulator